MCALQTISTTSSGGLSATYLNQLIAATMAQRKQPLTILQQERDQIQIQRAAYTDLKGMLSDLADLVDKMGASSIDSVFVGKQATPSDTTVMSAVASTGAVPGSYRIGVSSLAEAHQVASERYAYADQALNLSGDFVIGGAAQRSVVIGNATGAPIDTDPAKTFAGDGSAPAGGQTELGTGAYKLEFHKDGTTWKFRLVDSTGQAVNVAAADGSGAYTNAWQDFSGLVGKDAYDTGRGLKISFADPSGLTGDLMGDNAVTLQYQAKGASISVAATDSLQAIRDKINQGTYAAGNGVKASVIDNRLVLTAANMGYRIEGSGAVLGRSSGSGLGLLDWDAAHDDSSTDGWENTLAGWDTKTQALKQTTLTVNGLTIQRYATTGLSDVIGGVTLNLLKVTTSDITLSVADDNSNATTQANAFTAQFNKVTAYLETKTATTKNADGTYTRASLAGESVLTSLRRNLITDLVSNPGNLSATAAKSLAEIGITFNTDTMQLSLSDSAKFTAQLGNNHAGVTELLGRVMGQLKDRLDSFTGASGILTQSVTRLDKSESDLAKQISDMNARLADQETLLTRQYARLLAQYADIANQASYLGLSSFSTSG